MTQVLFLGANGSVTARAVPNLRFDPTLYRILAAETIEQVDIDTPFCLLIDGEGQLRDLPRNDAASRLMGSPGAGPMCTVISSDGEKYTFGPEVDLGVAGDAVVVGLAVDHYRGLTDAEVAQVKAILAA